MGERGGEHTRLWERVGEGGPKKEGNKPTSSRVPSPRKSETKRPPSPVPPSQSPVKGDWGGTRSNERETERGERGECTDLGASTKTEEPFPWEESFATVSQ
jgi:hypothetical protein